jgi:hypothetical protein
MFTRGSRRSLWTIDSRHERWGEAACLSFAPRLIDASASQVTINAPRSHSPTDEGGSSTPTPHHFVHKTSRRLCFRREA